MDADERLRILSEIASRSGSILRPTEISALLGSGPAARSLKQAKGIYKPAKDEHALWIRTTLKGQRRYLDEVPNVLTPTGRWQIRYSAEDAEGRFDPDLWTNRSLRACLEDRTPVAVFRQVIGNDGQLAYEVLGSALVTGWDGSHFTLQGGSEEDRPFTGLTALEENLPFHGFESTSHKVVLGPVIRRSSQDWFRSRVMWAYRERCALCGFGVRSAGLPRGLEAAHIIPVGRKGTSYDVRNGIALCANHHSLFDEPAWAWTLDEDLRVIVGTDPELRRTFGTNCLPGLEGQVPPYLPERASLRPHQDAIRFRMKEFNSHQRRSI